MGPVIVGVDGSTRSSHALRWGAAYARATGRRLSALRAWQYPASAGVNLMRTTALDAPHEIELEVGAELEALVRTTVPATEIRTMVARGDAAGAILHAARRHHADLIVVGSRGLGGFRGLLLGSVSRSLAEYAPCPVAIVRGFGALIVKKGGPVMVGVDGSDPSLDALRWSLDLAAPLGAEVLAVSALGPPAKSAARRRQIDGAIARVVGGAGRGSGVEFRWFWKAGDAREVLLDVAEREGPRVVVVGSRGLGGLTAVALGSVAYHLARYVRRPLVIVRDGR